MSVKLELSPEETKLYQNDFKLGKKHSYLIVEIVDEKLKITEKGGKDATKGDFIAAVKKRDACYGFFSGQKVFLVHWARDTSPVKKRMLYSTALDAVKTQLPINEYKSLHDDNELQAAVDSAV